jgi:hypothetical protein
MLLVSCIARALVAAASFGANAQQGPPAHAVSALANINKTFLLHATQLLRIACSSALANDLACRALHSLWRPGCRQDHQADVFHAACCEYDRQLCPEFWQNTLKYSLHCLLTLYASRWNFLNKYGTLHPSHGPARLLGSTCRGRFHPAHRPYPHRHATEAREDVEYNK